MQPHQQRVIDERSELSEKISKLQRFLEAKTSPIPSTKLARLESQLKIMCQYCAILDERISEFNNEHQQTKIPCLTIGHIRKALKSRRDDEMVHSQLVAADGTVWSMAAVIAPVYGQERGIVIDIRHPQLKTLPSS